MDKGLVRRSTGSLTLLALWHAFIAMLTLGCEPRVSAPPLVELSDVGPAELEPGDRLELHGKGFPQGRTARVRLHGTVFRAEASRLGHKTIEAEGTVLAPDRLRVDIESGFVERLCGTGDSASHATFEGSVEVAFASSTPDAPPVVAELEHVRLDVIPSSTRASVMAARKEKGERILHALGLTPGAPTSRGLPLEAITPGSVADHAGLRVGDILERVDGLRVLSLADIAPASSRTMGLALWRPDEGRTELKQLALKAPGLRALAEDLAPAIGMVTLGLLVLVFFLLPGPSSLRRLEAAFAQIARRTDLRAWFRSSAFARLGTTAVSLAGLALFASISSTLVRGFDGLLLFSAAASLLIAAQAFHHRGLRDFVRSLTATTLFLLVMAASLALGIAQLGALELSDAVRAQGAMPWQFSAVQHPSCAALSLAFLAALCRILRVHGKPPLRDHLLSQDFARAPALAPPPPKPRGTCRIDPRRGPRRGTLLRRLGTSRKSDLCRWLGCRTWSVRRQDVACHRSRRRFQPPHACPWSASFRMACRSSSSSGDRRRCARIRRITMAFGKRRDRAHDGVGCRRDCRTRHDAHGHPRPRARGGARATREPLSLSRTSASKSPN